MAEDGGHGDSAPPQGAIEFDPKATGLMLAIDHLEAAVDLVRPHNAAIATDIGQQTAAVSSLLGGHLMKLGREQRRARNSEEAQRG